MLMGLRFQNNEMLSAIFLIGVPYFLARCLERVHPVAVRIGALDRRGCRHSAELLRTAGGDSERDAFFLLSCRAGQFA